MVHAAEGVYNNKKNPRYSYNYNKCILKKTSMYIQGYDNTHISIIL